MKKNIKLIKDYPVSNSRAWDHPRLNLKLDWNEADEKIPLKYLDEAFKKYTNVNTHWYPKLINKDLLEAIKQYTGAKISNIVYGNGSDIVQEYIASGIINQGDRVLILSPNYDQFRKTANLCGANIKFLDFLDVNQRISWQNIDKYIFNNKPKLVYLSNPNNPTGLIFEKESLSNLINTHKSTYFLVDEAYGEFSNETLVSYINKFRNLIITRSLSKAFGAASIRFGYVLAHTEIIKIYKKVANAKSTPVFTQILANILINNSSYIKNRIKIINKNKEKIYKNLKKNNFKFLKSNCNFVLINLENKERKDKFINKLEKNNIYIRDLKHITNYENYVRITIGSSKKFNKIFSYLNDV